MSQVPRFFFNLQAPQSAPAPKFEARAIQAALGCEDVRHLGTGAFGDTWYAATPGGPRAVKVLYDKNYPAERLAREVEGLRRVSCDNVVELHDVRQIVLGGEDRPVLEFEYVHGGDSATRLQVEGALGEADAVGFAVGVLAGLVCLHAGETIHRDLKLANVALRNGAWESPVILDLGLARMLDWDTITIYPTLMGTLPYMSPEQLRGEPARKGADLWALGVILHVLLAGAHPFYGDFKSAVDLQEAQARVQAGPPSLAGQVSAPAAELICRLLAPYPYQRGSAQRALEDFSRIRGQHA